MASKPKRRSGRSRQTSPSALERWKWWFLGGGAVAAVVVLVVLANALSGPETSAPSTAAPDLVLADSSGREFRLSNQIGDPLLLYFSFPG